MLVDGPWHRPRRCTRPDARPLRAARPRRRLARGGRRHRRGKDQGTAQPPRTGRRPLQDGVVRKAAARSVPGVDLGRRRASAARSEGMLISGGGHAMAAGFSLDRASKTWTCLPGLPERTPRIRAATLPRIAADLLRRGNGCPCSGATVEMATVVGPIGARSATATRNRCFALPRARVVKRRPHRHR